MVTKTNVNGGGVLDRRKFHLFRGLILGVTVVVLTGFTVFLTLINYDANAGTDTSTVSYAPSGCSLSAVFSNLYNKADKTLGSGSTATKYFNTTHTVVLEGNFTLNASADGIKLPGNVTLDLNGHTLTVYGAGQQAPLTVYGNFYIKDSSGGSGKIIMSDQGNTKQMGLVQGDNSTHVVVQGGQIELRISFIVCTTGAHVDILGGTVKANVGGGLIIHSAGTMHRCGGSVYYDGTLQAKNHGSTTRLATAATCTAAGKMENYCACCGTVHSTETINALGHNYSATVVAPTCTAQGYTKHTCSRCNNTYNDTTKNALGHSYTESVTKAATCTAAGTKTKTCSRCSNKVTENINALGHNYGSTVVAPTCTAKGYTKHTCSRCSSSYNDTEKAALGHNYGTSTTTKAATCTAAGTKTKTCSRCNDVATETINALGHNYGSTVVAPTCTAKGYTKHTCSRCSSSYNDTEKAALGHSYNNTIVKPTCTTGGYTTHTCTRGDDTYTDSEVKALGHNYQHTVTAPTCTTAGYTTHTCTRGDDTYTDSAVDALGHNWGEWVIDQASTTEQEGSMHRNCRVCDTLDTATIPVHEHSYEDADNEIVDPTCTLDGFTRHHCATCDYYYDDTPVPAVGHDYQAVVTAPTCTAEGYTTHTCSRCKDEFVDTPTDMVPHTWDDGILTTPNTCAVAGERTYTCTVCYDNKTVTVPASGEHTWGDWVIDTEPTTVNPGQQHHLCTVCGEVATAVIPSLPAVVEPEPANTADANFDWVTTGCATAASIGLVGAGIGTAVALVRRKRRLGH